MDKARLLVCGVLLAGAQGLLAGEAAAPEAGATVRGSTVHGATNTGPSAAAPLTLKAAVDLALVQNLRLQASEKQLAADEAAVRQSGAPLGPSITAALSQVALDRDRAEASLGRAPQYRTSAALQLNQVVYADAPRANRQAQRSLQQAGSAEQEDFRLGIIAATGRRYLGLLEAQAQQRILADDLRLTDSNLDRARLRLELGVANKAELYRWQSRQASARRQLRSAQAAVERARIELNVVLNRPLAQPVEVIDPTLDDRQFLIADAQVWPRLVAGDGFPALREYCLEEAVAVSPVLAALRHRRAAQDRLVLKARREERMPSVDLAVSAVSYLAKGGAGTDQFSITIPGTTRKIGGETDDQEWTASMTASLPLYRGGARGADIDRARAEAERLDILYDAALQRLHADVLGALARLEASLANIGYARDAADAGRNNLELVTDSYARGIVTIIDLLDAQVASLTAQLAAANAVYDFMNDYLDLQLSVGRFDLALSPEEWQASLARLRSRLR